MNLPVAIPCYTRIDTLKQCVNSLIRYNPSKWYFHIQDSNNNEDQKLVDEVREYVKSLKLNKEVIETKEPIGCSRSVYKLLEYVKEEDVLFFEDDIILEDHEKLNDCIRENDEIVKFGECSELRSHFWGWYISSKTIKKIINFNFEEIEIPKKSIYDDLFWIATKEIYRRGGKRPWDEEVSLICDYLGINVKVVKPITKHIGEESSRVGKIKEFETQIIKFRNGKIVN